MKKITRESIHKEFDMPDDQAAFSREDLYKTLPSNAIVAEIGVDTGHNAAVINWVNSPKELYLIDPWESYERYNANWVDDQAWQQYEASHNNPRRVVEQWFANGRWWMTVAHPVNIKARQDFVFNYFADKHNVKIIKNYSVEASKLFEDHYFDWIYLEASREYEDIKADLAHWLPKVKKGGYITGGQFGLDKDCHLRLWPGPYGAIIEFIIKYVEKRPEIIDILQAHCDQINSETKTRWYHYIVSPDVREIVLKHIEYFPSKRWRGGNYKLQIGDWVDDLNYEEIIEEAKIK